MLKSTKRFLLSSETQNNQGFKVRTSGIDLSDFYNNPIMLFMHERPKGLSTNEVLPLGFWDDLEITPDGKIYGTPVFDDTDDFAKKIFNKVENGTIKMASAGIAPVQWGDNPDDLWLERSKGVEFSIVDRGSNPDSLSSAIALYDNAEKLITLSDLKTTIKLIKTDNMKLVTLSADTAGLLKLADGATPEQAHTAIETLIKLADSQKTAIDALTTDKSTLATEKLDLQTKLDSAVKLAASEKLIALVDKAIEDRKITADQKPDFVALSYEVAKPILDKMVASPSIISQVKKEGDNTDKSLLTMSWKELDKSDKLILLKAENFDVFKEKFKTEHGTEYTGAQ